MEPNMLVELLKKRAAAFDAFKVVADKPTLTPEEVTEYESLKRGVMDVDAQILRAKDVQSLAASTAQPVAGQEVVTTPATVNRDAYQNDKSLVIGGAMKMLGRSNGIISVARTDSIELYGENHPVTRALVTSSGSAGGFIVPPDYMNEIIELLRPLAVVRGAGPRVIPMPRGTMTLPGQASAATAGYGAEGRKIVSSQQTLNQIVASFKKLTALVPVSNDMMRYADPAVDAFVRDDLVKIIALTEDLNFILSDGTQDTPRGFLSFANGFAASSGGKAAVYSTVGNSTAAVGGNFITSTANYTLATVAAELGGAVNKLDTANVPDFKRTWFMHPRSYNYLYNVQNSLGVYVYRDELKDGKLLGYPFKKTTQIGTNYYNADGTQTDCSFIFLVEMSEDMILDSMSLELAVSREGTYIDASGTAISAFQNDQTIIRAIAEHDHQVRHDAAIAVIQFVRWAPALA
jgi:HK97 family phage major capsid protein